MRSGRKSLGAALAPRRCGKAVMPTAPTEEPTSVSLLSSHRRSRMLPSLPSGHTLSLSTPQPLNASTPQPLNPSPPASPKGKRKSKKICKKNSKTPPSIDFDLGVDRCPRCWDLFLGKEASRHLKGCRFVMCLRCEEPIPKASFLGHLAEIHKSDKM